MSTPTILLTGLTFGESPRWHQGRLWLCDWAQGEIIAVDLDGKSVVMARVPTFPFCIDPLPDGRLLVAGGDARVLIQDDGELRPYAELGGLTTETWDEIVVDARGKAYLDCIGLHMP